jgi:GNAT superfamily N-acetyltransferase
MNLSIINITLEELEKYLHSEEYKNSGFVPISVLRALSHRSNPRADKNDYCLFLAYDNDILIGYLGAITDWLFDFDKKHKVFWLSCMWVLPEYRRHGIAFNLLNHAVDIYSGNVLITNFIPQSKATFDKTGLFEEYANLKGIRAYVRFDFHRILPRKHPSFEKIKFVFGAFDFILNLPVKLKLKINQANFNTTCTFSEVEIFDENIQQFIHENCQESTFKRGVPEFDWMKKFPWVKRVKKNSKEASKYYFSQEAKDFRQWFIKVADKDQIVGFLLLTLFKGELKTPYLIYDKKYVKNIAAIIGRIIIQNKVYTYISYDNSVNPLLQKSGLFLNVRPAEYGFLISKTLRKKLQPKAPVLFDGDGDGAFT